MLRDWQAIKPQLMATAILVWVRQCPMNLEAKRGIATHIHRLLEACILIPCEIILEYPLTPSPENKRLPACTGPKGNKRVETIHLTVPNLYTLLRLLPPECKFYTILDLKDTFFSIPFTPASQPIFTFEWIDPEADFSGQLT